MSGGMVVRTRAVRDVEPLEHYVSSGGTAWLHDDAGFVGVGEALRIELGPGSGRFDEARRRFVDLATRVRVDGDDLGAPAGGLVAFGSFTFDARSHGSVLVVPRAVLRRNAEGTFLTTTTPAGEPEAQAPEPVVLTDDPRDRVRYAGSSVPDVLWLEAVADALRRLEGGHLEKVVLARDHAVWSKTPFEVSRLARHLVAHFPTCYTFVCDGLVGATPELLVRRAGSSVRSLVLAGSAPRDRDPERDRELGRALLESDKDRREHEIAVRSVLDVLDERCGEVHADVTASLLKLENVQHLATVVEAVATGEISSLGLAGALHPTAAVAGLPRGEAIATIRELEGMDRGRYAGPVGWMDAAGDGEWGIALRCADLAGARARLFAGAGIVPGSLPEDELEETRLKLRAMQDAFHA